MENQNIVTVEEFNGKFKINDFYRPIAAALQEKFKKELQWVPVKNILFIENQEDEKKKNNKIVCAQISKVPEKWADIVYQITGKHYEYMMEIFRENIGHMNREQIVALIYHELRHIQLIPGDAPKIGLVGHDVEDWQEMIEKLGAGWNATLTEIPDLLDKDVTWENIEGPPTLFPAETGLRRVK